MYSNLKLKYLIISFIAGALFAFLYIVFSSLFNFANITYLPRYFVFYFLSIIIVYRIQIKYKYYLPSFYLFSFFSLIPPIGVYSYLYIYKKLYPNYLGVNLDMDYALDVWLQGLFFLMLGIFIAHFFYKKILKGRKRESQKIYYFSWDWQKFDFMLFALTCIASFFTLYAVFRLGYIPIMKGNIDRDRFYYYTIVGAWPLKLARLWLVIYIIGFFKLLKNIRTYKRLIFRENILLLFLLMCCFVFDSFYGDRIDLFVMVVFSIVMANKYLWRVKNIHIAIIVLSGILIGNMIQYQRTKSYKVFTIEKILGTTFNEFHAFSYAVQEFPNNSFLKGKAFYAAFLNFFPQVVLSAFNIDKKNLSREYSSAGVMGKIFGHYMGVRIGIIGEGYINFGYVGILIIPFISGLLFGFIENIFICTKLFDIKDLIIAYAISIMIFLPLAQFDGLVALFMYNIYIIFALVILFAKKTLIPSQ